MESLEDSSLAPGCVAMSVIAGLVTGHVFIIGQNMSGFLIQ